MPLGVIVMRNISEITPEQITQRLNEIYKPISYCREMDYFRMKPINASLTLVVVFHGYVSNLIRFHLLFSTVQMVLVYGLC